MIARVWHGRIRSKDVDEYVRYLQGTGLQDYRSCGGNRGALMLVRENGNEAEVFTISLWDSLENIEAFAGMDISRARYYPRDEQFLLELEESVRHFNTVGETEAVQAS